MDSFRSQAFGNEVDEYSVANDILILEMKYWPIVAEYSPKKANVSDDPALVLSTTASWNLVNRLQIIDTGLLQSIRRSDERSCD